MTKRARKPETNGDGYRDRIVGFKRIPAGKLIPNEKNWRTHPTAQQDALRGVLAEIGISDALIARKVPEGYQLLDGHLRTDVAPDTKWPVLIVDLDDDEADKLLATLDPLAAMAGASTDKLIELLNSLEPQQAEFSELLRALSEGEGMFEIDEAGMPGLPDGDRDPFQQMTFTLSDDQAGDVKRAMDAAKKAGPFVDSGNENSNGNALARIVEAYLGTC